MAEPHDETAAPRWPVYDGAPESVSDGVAPIPGPPGRPRRWPWAMAGLAVVTIVISSNLSGTSSGPVPEPGPAAVVAPAAWGRVDPSLTAGVVTVHGGGEADGIVLTSTGLIATSYSRIRGDSRPPTDGFELRVAVDGHDAVPATIVGTNEDADLALVSASAALPLSVATPGSPVRVGDVLTLLDDQGGNQPIVGIGVTVKATDRVCSRAGSMARPTGFGFSLSVASAEPGAALVRADGTVVGMYYGGDDAAHHCAIPIADILQAA